MELCGKCAPPENEADELHTCPYLEDINGDARSLCNCCDDCSQNCADDI